jgi:hypothetical protein
MPAFRFCEYLHQFWSYRTHDYTVIEPRLCTTCLSRPHNHPCISHGDIHPTIWTLILPVSMESTSLLDQFSAIAEEQGYVLILGQPLSQLQHTSWYIPPQPAPSIPLVLRQHVLLLSLTSRVYFGHLQSIIRLERLYLAISVSPEPNAYGPFPPDSCTIYLPMSFISLPWTCRIQYLTCAPLLSNDIHE